MQAHHETKVVRSAKQGDRDAFGELVSRYQNLVIAIALSRTGDFQRSEDIAQQAFVIAWQKLGELEEPARFGAWLAAITRNTVRNSNRRAGLLDRKAESLHPHDVPKTTSTPLESSSLAEQQHRLWDCLQGIPDDYREPLVLYYRQDKSMQEVAAQLGLSVAAVKKRLSRGRAMIKDEARQFVEDILGASQPSSSFAVAVVAALPVAAGTGLGKGGGAAVVKNAAAKAVAASTKWSMWIGIFGLIYGMGANDKMVGATIVKNQLFWFLKIATIVSALLSVIVIAAYAWVGEASEHYILVGGAIYAAVLTVATVYFVLRQKRLDRIHGRVKARFEVSDIQPATPRDFKKAITGASLGSWAWLFFAAFDHADYGTLGLAVAVMWGVNALRRRQSVRATTIPAQMRFQAINFTVHVLLSSVIFWLAEQLGRPTRILDLPNWQPCIMVLALGFVASASAWRASNKFARTLQTAEVVGGP